MPDTPIVSVHGAERDAVGLSALIQRYLPACAPRTILIKPNWVRHESNAAFPIRALVTDTTLIGAAVDACLRAYPDATEITVGDVPLQDCDWNRLAAQAGIDTLARTYAGSENPRVTFRDLRRERFVLAKGFLAASREGDFGDPRGYREVRLGGQSFLEPISAHNASFRVSDYDGTLTSDSHRSGHHRYLVSGTALTADLVINMPKMKTHQKAGITGALKNLVGINGQKAYLVHYRRASSAGGGDEFAPGTSLAVRAQVRVRELLQKRSRFFFSALRGPWRMLRRLRGIQTEGTRENLERTFYMAGGAWYGNDTIWRMIYDLNRIILYAHKDGALSDGAPQRHYLAILDGMTAGEGNGPLQPLAVETGIVGFSRDPFAMDHVMARLMGFDAERIPQLAHHREFPWGEWGARDADKLSVELDGKRYEGVPSLPVLHRFLPPPGWRSHIELTQ